jgi:hypothetical protein
MAAVGGWFGGHKHESLPLTMDKSFGSGFG